MTHKRAGSMDFRVLGRLEVYHDRQRVPVGPAKSRAILAVLLIHANELVATDRLVTDVWGENPPRTAIHALHNHVSHLRKAFAAVTESPVIETTAPGYTLRAGSESLDSARFERLVEGGRSALSSGQQARARMLLEAGLALWHGEPFAEFSYAEFAQAERRRLAEVRLSAIEAIFTIDIATSNHRDVIAPLHRAIEENPFREHFRHQLMTALYLSGRQSEALRAYREFAEMLIETSGIEPSPLLQELEARILRHDPVLMQLESATPASQPESRASGGGVGELADDFLGPSGVILLEANSAPHVGVLFIGRENDRGYNDLALAGIKRAVGALDIEHVAIPRASAGTEWELRQASRAVGEGLLIVMGFPYQPYLGVVAPDFPDVEYFCLDHTSPVPGVTSIYFRDHEGGFLAGAAAARKSVTGRLGFLGGMRLPVIERFLAGFAAGARRVDAGVELNIDWIAEDHGEIGAFMSPSLGFERGRKIYESGVDILMHAAGASGFGIFEAARVAQRSVPRLWAIGVDSDQYLNVRDDLKPHVLTSVVKRSDLVMFEAIRSWTQGALERGSSRSVGLVDGVLGYSRSGGFVDDVAEDLDALVGSIISGSIIVPHEVGL